MLPSGNELPLLCFPVYACLPSQQAPQELCDMRLSHYAAQGDAWIAMMLLPPVSAYLFSKVGQQDRGVNKEALQQEAAGVQVIHDAMCHHKKKGLCR